MCLWLDCEEGLLLDQLLSNVRESDSTQLSTFFDGLACEGQCAIICMLPEGARMARADELPYIYIFKVDC